MSGVNLFLVFRLDEQRYSLPLASVERVLRAVAVTPLPDAPAVILGAVNIHGRVVPVLNLRHRCSLPARSLTPADAFVLIRRSQKPAIIVVDTIDGILESPTSAVVPVDAVAPAAGCIPGLITLDDGLVLIQDVERFMTLDEERALNDAIDETPRL